MDGIHYPKINFTYLFLLLFTACKTTQAAQPAKEHPNSVLSNRIVTTNMYIGISPRMRIHEKEIDNAKLHIAHQIAMRSKCIVDVGALYITEGKDDIYESDYGFDYDDTNIEELVEHIEIIADYVFKDLILLIGKDTRKTAQKNPQFPGTVTERPQWIHNPQIVSDSFGAGYMVGIGIADKYTQLYKGIYAADLAAAQAIASEKEMFTDMYSIDVVENKSTYFASGTLSMSEGVELTGFYILDRWIEPDGSQYYSLGIANRN
jgi:hypothetical protein